MARDGTGTRPRLPSLIPPGPKRARAAAGYEPPAHARWEQIDLGDVAPVIEVMKELSGRILDKGLRVAR